MKTILIKIEGFLCSWTISHSFGGITALNIQAWMNKRWPYTKWDGKTFCPDCNKGMRLHPGDIFSAKHWTCDDCGRIAI